MNKKEIEGVLLALLEEHVDFYSEKNPSIENGSNYSFGIRKESDIWRKEKHEALDILASLKIFCKNNYKQLSDTEIHDICNATFANFINDNPSQKD